MNRLPKTRSLAAIVGITAAAGLMLLTPRFEGTKLTTYRDMVGVLTYCTGAIENAQWGKTYTPAECRARLDYDLARHAEGVMACVLVPLTDGQKIAFVDTAFNIGVSAFCSSSMARKANAGDMPGACQALMRWVMAGGRVVQGLVNRRAIVREYCDGVRK